MRYTKGHGTENDFVILDDPAGELDLSPGLVAAICDRQRGIGADGLLRVVRAGQLVAAGMLAELPEGVAADDWFMDYRNADGSIAEMCGNGVRVFAHYLRAAGHTDADRFTVGSRAGARPVIVHSADPVRAEVSVEMGRVRLRGTGTARVGGVDHTGVAVDVGNPHLACVVAGGGAELDGLDLSGTPELDAVLFPHGANIEFVTPARSGTDSGHRARMRVIERGVGETRSCGTGLVAAATATLAARGETAGRVTITVPGGVAEVTLADGAAVLRGPSVLVADGRLRPGWQG